MTLVRLRPLTTADVDALVEASEGRAFGPSSDERRARLHKQLERRLTLEHDGFLSLGVEADGQLVGDIQARSPKNAFPPGVCEIGITLFAAARGKGIGSDAIAQFTELLFEKGLKRVQASPALDNVAMRRVLERVGYEYEGVLRSFAPDADGTREDYAIYAAVAIGRTTS